MKITGFRSLTTQYRWGRSVGDANGRLDDAVTEVPILILETDVGVEGVGLGAHRDIDRVFPAVEGEDPRAVTALYDRMIRQVFKSGHQGATFGAIGAVDLALWDLKAKLANEPLWRLLGGRDRFVPGYASGLDAGLSNAELVTLYSAYGEHGFRSAKVKGGLDVERDRARLELVRDALGKYADRPALILDANEAWSPKQAIHHVRKLEESVDLAWVEEPVRRWDADGHHLVRTSVRTAVATGENLTGLEQFRPLVVAGAVDILQAGSVWGITHYLRVAALAHAHDLSVSPVGYHTNPLAAPSAALPNVVAIEIQSLDQPLGITVDQCIGDGGLLLGSEPGAGITVDESAISAVASTWSAPAGPHVRPLRAGLRILPES